MIRVRRSGAAQSTPLLLVGAALLFQLLTPLSAGAQTIAQTQAEIANLSNELSQQEKTSEITANAYDADQATLANLNANIVKLQSQ